MLSDPLAMMAAPQVDAAAKRLWSFLGLRRPWDQATEVSRDKARMLAAVVLEGFLDHERELRSATAEDTILARYWPLSHEEPVKQDFAEASAFCHGKDAELCRADGSVPKP